MPSVVNKISNSNDNFISFLENPLVKYSVLIFITLLIILIEKIDTKYLEVFDLDIFKIVYALLIAYTACFDPIYAIILTTFMIMAIQEVHSRRSNNAINQYKRNEIRNTNANTTANVKTNTNPNVKTNTTINVNDNANDNEVKSNNKVKQSLIPSTINNHDNHDNHDNINSSEKSQSVVYESMPDNDILISDKLVYNLINKHALQKTPDVNDVLDAEYDYYDDPAFKTLTNNLKEKNTHSKNDFFVTNDDLINVQNNTQEGVDQNTSMKAFTSNILNIQGLPNGYDPKSPSMGFM